MDETCHLIQYSVYIDNAGVIYDASLNQTNASNNNNKFYRLQVRRTLIFSSSFSSTAFLFIQPLHQSFTSFRLLTILSAPPQW
jgi:hypothetical protein